MFLIIIMKVKRLHGVAGAMRSPIIGLLFAVVVVGTSLGVDGAHIPMAVQRTGNARLQNQPGDLMNRLRRSWGFYDPFNDNVYDDDVETDDNEESDDEELVRVCVCGSLRYACILCKFYVVLLRMRPLLPVKFIHQQITF